MNARPAREIEVAYIRMSAWGCGIIGLTAAAACILTDSCTLLVETFLYVVDTVVAIASVAIARKLESPPDERFPFGYHKLEPAVVNISATLLVAGSLIGILFAVQDIRHYDSVADYPLALGYAAFATLVSGGLWLGAKAAQARVNSPLLKAEALTWGIALIESAGVLAGFAAAWALEHQPDANLRWLAPFVDPVMAIGLSVAILKEPLRTYVDSSSDLLDANLQSDLSRQVRDAVVAVVAARQPPVPVQAVRLRRAGRRLFVHVELAIPNEITMAAVRRLHADVEKAIRAVRPETLFVTFG